MHEIKPPWGESELVVPPWAGVERTSPQLPPMAISLPTVKYHSGRVEGRSCLAYTYGMLHRSGVPVQWLSFPSGAHGWLGWLAQVGVNPMWCSLSGVHACGQSTTCSSTKISCTSLSVHSLPIPIGFVIFFVPLVVLSYFILHHAMHSWLCIRGVISNGHL